MQIPLNIDWQQILLHWLNLAILAGGLYFLLFKPVKQFMEKREDHYREMEEQAAGKLREAERIQESYRQKLEKAGEEIHAARQMVQQSAEEQLAQAQKQAKEIVAQARAQAEHTKEQAMKESQRELKKLATEAAEKIAFGTDQDPFDQFLNLAEGGGAHEGR